MTIDTKLVVAMFRNNKRLLIIRSKGESFWTSCKTISKNLTAAYLGLEDREVNFYDIPQDFIKQDALFNTDYIENLAKKIQEENPSEVVFIDHVPHACKILKALESFLKIDKMPPLIFHIYGDFTYFSNEWIWFSANYHSHPVKFITASHAQENQLRFFSKTTSGVHRYLFPLDSNDFYFSSKERVQWRKENQISEDEIILLYSGRISLQKNIDLLIRKFVEIHENNNKSFSLIIAGEVDDIGAPFMGVKGYEGYMFSKIQQELKFIPSQIKNKIRFLGNVERNELRKVNNASDIFLSFSLYHDEDFGMSPAEALATGLPSLLTAWGGYISFENSADWACRLVPVTLSEFGHKLDFTNLDATIMNYSREEFRAERAKRADAFMKYFSVEGSRDGLKKILNEEFVTFDGFNYLLNYLSLAQDQLRATGASEQLTPSSENFYGQIYKNYIESNKSSYL